MIKLGQIWNWMTDGVVEPAPADIRPVVMPHQPTRMQRRCRFSMCLMVENRHTRVPHR